MDDNIHMQAVIAGHIDRLGILYEKYKEPLFSYFFKVTRGDQSTAEDLVQTVFHRVLKYKQRYSGSGNFGSWLFSIARNCGIDYHRNKHYLYNIDQCPNQFMGTGDTEESILRMEQISTLYHALDQLKPNEKEVLVLGKINELKYKDIADILDCSESAVRVRIFRALQKLKEVYLKLELAGK